MHFLFENNSIFSIIQIERNEFQNGENLSVMVMILREQKKITTLQELCILVWHFQTSRADQGRLCSEARAAWEGQWAASSTYSAQAGSHSGSAKAAGRRHCMCLTSGGLDDGENRPNFTDFLHNPTGISNRNAFRLQIGKRLVTSERARKNQHALFKMANNKKIESTKL